MALWLTPLCAMKSGENPLLSVDQHPNTAISSILCPPALRAALPTEGPLSSSHSNFGVQGWGCRVTQPLQEKLHSSSGCRRLLETITAQTGFQSDWICSAKERAKNNFLLSQMLSCGGDICHTWKCFWKRRGESICTQKDWVQSYLGDLGLQIHELRNPLSKVLHWIQLGLAPSSPWAQCCWMAQSGTLGMRKNWKKKRKNGISYDIYITGSKFTCAITASAHAGQ